MASVDGGDGICAFGYEVARDEVYTRFRFQPVRVKAKVFGQIMVYTNKAGCCNRHWHLACVKPFRESRVAVIEGWGGFGVHQGRKFPLQDRACPLLNLSRWNQQFTQSCF